MLFWRTNPNKEEPHMPTPSGHTRAIRAKKVIGADVKNEAGEKLGKVEDVVLDKMSNDIMFAVVGFGGVMGMGEKFHPIPWSMLDYDPNDDAYICAVTMEQLKAAPSDSIDALTKNDGVAFRDRSYEYYGTSPYWA
jgi:sporulation protein YlmC with PRC-barrel domain